MPKRGQQALDRISDAWTGHYWAPLPPPPQRPERWQERLTRLAPERGAAAHMDDDVMSEHITEDPVETIQLYLQRWGAKMAISEPEFRLMRDPAREWTILSWCRKVATIRGTNEIEVPETWFDHLLLAKPWLRKLAARFGREPHRKVYRADLILPDWILQHPIRNRYESYPHFTRIRQYPDPYALPEKDTDA